ncbi:MAG: oligosaccharide flippase family protein, partial [Gammaproteobacteria bacterium]|nr:oligosaccharide flippase family protein [Gammaproteobacteria bacterium]
MASIILRVSNIVLGLILTILMARMLGASGYGVYSYILAIITVISIPAQFGIPKLVIRETAKAQVNQDWALLRGVWRWSTLAVLLLSIFLVGLSALIALNLTDSVSGQELNVFILGLLLIPFIALGSLRAASLQGLRHIVLGQLPENIIRPVVFIILLITLSTTLQQGTLITPWNAMGAHVVATFIAFLAGVWFLLKKIPSEIHGVNENTYQQRAWFHAILPLALTAGMNQINNYADIIMLGLYYPAE